MKVSRPGNATIAYYRPTGKTTRKSQLTITTALHPEHTKSKATSSHFYREMFAKLEKKQSFILGSLRDFCTYQICAKHSLIVRANKSSMARESLHPYFMNGSGKGSVKSVSES